MLFLCSPDITDFSDIPQLHDHCQYIRQGREGFVQALGAYFRAYSRNRIRGDRFLKRDDQTWLRRSPHRNFPNHYNERRQGLNGLFSLTEFSIFILLKTDGAFDTEETGDVNNIVLEHVTSAWRAQRESSTTYI